MESLHKTKERKPGNPIRQPTKKHVETGGGTLGGESEHGGEEGGVAGGNIVGGNPVDVTAMKVASFFSSGSDDQSGASGPTPVTPGRRGDLLCCLAGQNRMAGSKASGSKPHRGQEVSASGDLQVGWAAR